MAAGLRKQEECEFMKDEPRCKICRRVGKKLFLKGEKCHSPKCPLVKRRYPHGFQGKSKRRKYLSEYGKEVREKQKLRHSYNLKEKVMRKYAKKALSQRGKVDNSQEFFIQSLEMRLDNVIYRLGLAPSRSQARQMVSHAHFEVNGKKVNIPSYKIKQGDKVSIREKSKDKENFAQLEMKLKDYEMPSWLKFNIKKAEGEVVGIPTIEEAAPPADIANVFEYYSR